MLGHVVVRALLVAAYHPSPGHDIGMPLLPPSRTPPQCVHFVFVSRAPIRPASVHRQRRLYAPPTRVVAIADICPHVCFSSVLVAAPPIHRAVPCLSPSSLPHTAASIEPSTSPAAAVASAGTTDPGQRTHARIIMRPCGPQWLPSHPRLRTRHPCPMLPSPPPIRAPSPPPRHVARPA